MRGFDGMAPARQAWTARNALGTRGLDVTVKSGLVVARWLLAFGIGAWAINQIMSAADVLAIKFGDAISAGIDPSLIIIVESMGPFLVLLTVANATCYAASTVFLIGRFAAALPVYAAAMVFDLTGWVVYSSNSIYDFWAASTSEPADWVVNGLLMVGLIAMILLRQAGVLPHHVIKAG
ncbi:hypothetical protein [Maricaulis sp.]|uniref:hypothetical protein n=1 Tax=Maricaulis sp. TaxID=1486257 RepID=UPI0025C43E51|nr:hypothetical protein [Maricaulis sp.]